MIPVSLTTVAGVGGAPPRAGGSTVRPAAPRHFEDPLLLPEFDPGDPSAAAALWALHLGAVVSPLSAAEAGLVTRLNEANPQLVTHRARVARIDYADFELQGDYREFCRRRHAPFWGGA